ncbi:MAG: cupin domain-containing protein [Pseudomonadota bacterium]
MPKIDKRALEPRHRQAYPGRLRQHTSGCWKWMLSDAGGLTQFGAGEIELAPGSASSLYHWHMHEDEFVYVLSGEVVLVEDGLETILRKGDCATFKAGERVGHSFENRGSMPARLLEVGTRARAGETVYYPGLDMIYRREASGRWFETHAGRRLSGTDEVRQLLDD